MWRPVDMLHLWCIYVDIYMYLPTVCFFWGYMSINVPYMEHHLESTCRRKELDKTLPWAQWWNCMSKSAEKKQKQKNFREFLLHQVLEWTRQQRPLHRSSVLAVSIPLFLWWRTQPWEVTWNQTMCIGNPQRWTARRTTLNMGRSKNKSIHHSVWYLYL